MSAWLKKNKNLWMPTIFVLVFGFVAVAYAVIEFALTGRVVPGALLIAGLIVPSLLLPVFAFGSSAQSARRSQDLVREKNTQLNVVMDNMAQGLCMFDGDQRLILSNRLYAEMYGLSNEIVRPGTTFREILQYRIENGLFAGADADAYLDERMAAIAENDRSTKIQKLTDGRTIAICHTPMPGGGWLATHEDISEQIRSQVALMESEAHLRAILDNAPFCLNLKDMDGRYIFANKGYEGKTPDGKIAYRHGGKALAVFYDGHTALLPNGIHRQLRRPRQPSDLPLRLRRKHAPGAVQRRPR